MANEIVFISDKGAPLSISDVDGNADVLDKRYFSSTIAPTTNNDSTQGFKAGRSMWFVPSTNTLYKCTDDTVATAVWEEVIVESVPSGGTTGQVLSKASSTDYDAQWSDPVLTALNYSTIQADPESFSIGDGNISTEFTSVGYFYEAGFDFATRTITFVDPGFSAHFSIGDSVAYLYDTTSGNNQYHSTTIESVGTGSVVLTDVSDIVVGTYSFTYFGVGYLLALAKTDTFLANKHQYIFGDINTILGVNCVVMGEHNYITGQYGYVLGTNNHLDGDNIYMIGSFNYANSTSSNGLILGMHNIMASGTECCVVGVGLHTGTNNQTLIGRYNEGKVDTLFEIGNGSDDVNRNNVFEIFNNKSTNITRSSTITTSNVLAKNIESILADATSGNLIVTLPDADINCNIRVIKTDVSVNTVTIQHATATINGSATHVISTQYGSVDIISDGTNFYAS